MNYGSSQTNDFEVNLSRYAPKQSLVTRVQLVDVDIPNTQLLIEPAWDRMYFDMGVRTSAQCRGMTVSTHQGSCVTQAALLLPLPIDAVTTFDILSSEQVRLNMAHRVPVPLKGIASAWAALGLRNLGSLTLNGIPGMGPLPLLPLHPQEDTPLSFIITSPAVVQALLGTTPALFLKATPLPGPTYLANVATRCLSAQLGAPVNIAYCGADDTFACSVRSAGAVLVEGPLAEYMGFGARTVAELGTILPKKRASSPQSYAALQTGDPRTPAELADWVTSAFNAFSWLPFQFGVAFPGGASTTVTVPGGQMTLPQLATVIDGLLPSPIRCKWRDAPHPGLVFYSPALVFSLDWTVDAGFQPSRVGFDRLAYPPALIHLPTRPAWHVPELQDGCDACALPPSTVTATYRGDTGQLVLQTRPYGQFTADVLIMSGNVYSATAAIIPGLEPGAYVVLVLPSGPYEQVLAVVVDAPPGSASFKLALVDPDQGAAVDASASPLLIVPQDASPLVLYFQKQAAPVVDPETFGFDATTYESCGALLVSPGSLEICQDSYVLVCLAFAAGGAIPSTGDVYYPFLGGSIHGGIVFAKVLRSTFLKADFDRVFDHTFSGSGLSLGYIRVQILNPNGTPYQTHGHSLSITLRFDARQSYLTMGGGGHVSDVSRQEVAPLSRGSVLAAR